MSYDNQRVRRIVTPEAALTKLMVLASRAEKCSSDAYVLLKRWGIEDAESCKIVARLVSEKYIDDRRYAKAFARDKMRYSGWGTFKIAQALKMKAIPKEVIDESLEELDPEEKNEKLKSLLQKKLRQTTAKNDYELRSKLFRYALSKGYEYDAIESALSEI